MTNFQPGDLVEVINPPMVHGVDGLLAWEIGWDDVPPVIGDRFTVSVPVDDDGDLWLWVRSSESIPIAPECLRLLAPLSELTGEEAFDLVRQALVSEDWRARRQMFKALGDLYASFGA